MKQKFFLVAHNTSDNELNVEVDKVFLQWHDAIKWGRTLATNNASYKVYLYEQEITRNGVLRFVKLLTPYRKESE